ncbi:MAG: universal stress protein [Bryobacterales bacterium]
MESIHKILTPIDFSPASGDAARYAAEIAPDLNAELTLLHVAPPITFDFAMTQPASERFAELTKHRHQTLRHAFDLFPPGQESLGPNVRREVVEGDPAEEILRRAHDHGYGLIVMPTRGSSPLRRWLVIGSVTSKVLHGAECPVLAGTEFGKSYNPRQVRHILSAVDLGPQTERVLRWGAGLARHYGAPLTIVHAMPDAGAANEDFFDPSWRSTLSGNLREKIAGLMKANQIEGDIAVESGDAHKVVASAAKRLEASVVVIGRGVSSDLLGRLRAQAYEIIRRSPCPVLSV